MGTIRERIERRRRTGRALQGLKAMAGVALVAALVAGGVLVSRRAHAPDVPKPPSSPGGLAGRTAEALSQGDWPSAIRLVQECGAARSDEAARAVWAEAMKPLKVQMEFHASRAHREGGEDALRLSRDDEYWLVLKVFGECYLYVIQETSNGAIKQLFPSLEGRSEDNPVTAGTYAVPGGLERLRLDADIAGTETVHLVAAPWRQEQLERLLGVAQPEAAEGTPAPATEVLKWLKQADEHTAMLPALACTSYSFEHVPSQATAAPGAIRPAPEAGGPAQTSPTGEPQS